MGQLNGRGAHSRRELRHGCRHRAFLNRRARLRLRVESDHDDLARIKEWSAGANGDNGEES